MTQEIEIEFKNLLEKEEYDQLLNSIPFPSEGKLQINHYFETKEFSLKELGCAIRIREKDGKYTLTLKEPHPDGLLETHDLLTEQEALNWMNGTIIPKVNTSKQLLKKNIQPEKLTYYGSLSTLRREVPYQDVLLVLDYSTYNHKTDYELELEAPTKADGLRIFHQLLEENKIEQRITPNKIERFFHSLEK
ncbi:MULTISPECIES: CYTH domain-containing protein [Oceanobacillus]|uniref:CYTH domain-containing protein n=1 Tax=Oceanobacillus profundus TaxID=372463 RepID=A0A417YLT4_9BACI|nr:CYTH domain-containing protein [Oceanobacillus profundus]MCM3399206.1 CYTH domain-containing protein [Oceanobacillus profundus]RHW34449.1 CYTH domain-containing protein [Oceanobacillus profundus]